MEYWWQGLLLALLAAPGLLILGALVWWGLALLIVELLRWAAGGME